MIEPETKAVQCPYCGDSPTNHTLEYIGTILSIHIEPHTAKITKYAPQFIKNFVDFLPGVVIPLLTKLGFVKYETSIDNITSFRSRIIWEEADRRGIPMQQIIAFGKPLEFYRAKLKGKWVYFESLPIPPKFMDTGVVWDDKQTLKKALGQNSIPVPAYATLSQFGFKNLRTIFDKFTKPIIVKPRIGSRGRHTTTNVNSFDQFKYAVKQAHQITPYVIVEEHLHGDICRATLVNGKLAGFYRASAPFVIGDGVHTISELIEEKNNNRHERIQPITITPEKREYIERSGLNFESIPESGRRVQLTHRIGRFFGGTTSEMPDQLHPSFVPILEKAAKVVGLAVAGFDVVVPDPTADQATQKWGIIECNTLPFIDLHYYALEGKPRNIAGMIWDLWDK